MDQTNDSKEPHGYEYLVKSYIRVACLVSNHNEWTYSYE